MTTKAKPIKYVLLHAKPQRTPAWWPRDCAGDPAWVCVAPDGGGFSLVWSRQFKIRARLSREIREAFEELQGRSFYWKVEAL